MSTRFGQKAVLRAALLTTGSTQICFAIGLLVSVLVARSLGPEDYGRYAYIVWLTGMMIMIANNGMNVTGIKFVAESLGRDEPEVAAQIHGWLYRFQVWCIGGSILLASAILPLVRPKGWTGDIVLLVVVVNLAMSFKALSMFNTSMAKGYGRFGVEAVTSLAAAVATAVMALALAYAKASAFAFVLMFMVSNLVYLLVSTFMMRREGLLPNRRMPNDELLARVRPHLWWTVFLTLIAAASNRSIETMLLNAWVGIAEVGYFAIATGLSRAGTELLASGLSTVVMPFMGYAFGSGDPARIRRVFEDTTRYYQFLGLILAGGGWFWAEVIVRLMYGEMYMSAAPVMRIMVVSAGLMLAASTATAVLANSDNQKFRTGVALGTLILTGVFAFAMIPSMGIIGAALAFSLATVASTAALVIGIKHYVGLDVPWRLLMRQYVAASLAAAMGWMIVKLGGDQLGAWLAGPIYGLVLIWLSVILGVWRDDELMLVSDYLTRVPRIKAWLKPLTFGRLR